jgi:hypothetical protein
MQPFALPKGIVMKPPLLPIFCQRVLGSDFRQRLRIGRLLLASSTCLFGIFIVRYCRWYGLFPAGAYEAVLGSAIALNLVFYLLIRFDLNLGARDPSLTFPQMLVACLANTYLGPTRQKCGACFCWDMH